MNTLHYFVWNINPVITKIGSLELRWYGLLFAGGLGLGYWLMMRIFESEGKPVEKLDTFLLYFIIGTVVGARLGHVFFYDWAYYKAHPLEIIMVQHGGLASHGAAIGILLATWLFIHFHFRGNLVWLLDRLAVLVPLGGAFIRIGNFFNSEILGKITDVPWAIIFARIDNKPRHPAQLYEALAYILIFLFMYFYLFQKKKIKQRSGELTGWFFILIFGFRFFIEFIKIKQSDLIGQNWDMDMGQLLSIPLVLFGIALIIWARKNKWNTEKEPKNQ